MVVELKVITLIKCTSWNWLLKHFLYLLLCLAAKIRYHRISPWFARTPSKPTYLLFTDSTPKETNAEMLPHVLLCFDLSVHYLSVCYVTMGCEVILVPVTFKTRRNNTHVCLSMGDWWYSSRAIGNPTPWAFVTHIIIWTTCSTRSGHPYTAHVSVNVWTLQVFSQTKTRFIPRQN